MVHGAHGWSVPRHIVAAGAVALALGWPAPPAPLGWALPVAAAQGVPQGQGAAQGQPAPAGAPLDAGLAREVELVNAERQKAGLAPLAVETHLTLAAQHYAELMASSGCFSHTCGPVPELPQRVEGAGYPSWTRLAENIAAGQRTPEEVVAGWMGSPGHRANILNPDFTEIGVGQARGGPYGTYWGQVFGRPAPPAPPALAPQEAAARVFDLLNAERQKAGVPPLRVSPALAQEAQHYAEVLASGDCFGSSCGTTPELQQRVQEAGYTTWAAVAENIAAGQATPEDAVAQWVSGAGQAALDPRYSEAGVGVAYGGHYRIYWTQTLGSTDAEGAPPPTQQ